MSTSNTLTKTDLTNILNEIVAIDGTDMTQQEVTDFINSLTLSPTNYIDVFYPVGSYYETSDSTFNPNTAWGGTWVLETEGQVHVSAGENYDVGDTGGAETVTLTTSQIPAHTHGSKTISASFSGRRCGSDAVSHWAGTNTTITASSTSTTTTSASGTANKHSDIVNISVAHTHNSVGGSGAHENMPPYIVVNRWHRIG